MTEQLRFPGDEIEAEDDPLRDVVGDRCDAEDVDAVERAQISSAEVEDVSLTVFSDGRCVVRGTGDLLRARSLYERYIGR